MLTHRMTIQNQDYVLEASTDIDTLQVEICDAMRHGGGIVSFTTATRRPLTAIVSPGIPVMFEAVLLPDDGPSADAHPDPDVQAHLDGY